MNDKTKTPFALTLGASLIASLGATTAHADPFVMTDLSYNQTTGQGAILKVKDGACGEGKCGGNAPSKVEKTVEGEYENNEVDSAVDQVIESDNDAIQEMITDEDEAA